MNRHVQQEMLKALFSLKGNDMRWKHKTLGRNAENKIRYISEYKLLFLLIPLKYIGLLKAKIMTSCRVYNVCRYNTYDNYSTEDGGGDKWNYTVKGVYILYKVV